MNLTDRDYAISAYCEAAANQLDHRIMWDCINNSTSGTTTNCRQLDTNVQAAITAAEWLANTTRKNQS
jgi:hypothetical protein